MPDGVLQVLPGPGGSLGRHLSLHEDIDGLTFTGSTAVGKLLMQQCAGTVKKVAPELGDTAVRTGVSPDTPSACNGILPSFNSASAMVMAVSSFDATDSRARNVSTASVPVPDKASVPAPVIEASDLAKGFLVLEDLGDTLLREVHAIAAAYKQAGEAEAASVRAYLGELTRMADSDGAFDAAYSMGTVEHFDETEEALEPGDVAAGEDTGPDKTPDDADSDTE